jgi:hypothetical protein
MSPDTTGISQPPGLPDPNAVVEEVNFTPNRPAGSTRGLETDQAPTYKILKTTETDTYDQPPPATEPTDRGLAPAAPGDDYHGTSRKEAKLSLGAAAVEVFADLQALIGSLPADESMIHHHPAITDTANSGRVSEEQRNVQVRAFLYAASREADNDFHLIIGRDRQLTPHLYMTMELSALPPQVQPGFATFKATRDAFKDFFGTHLPGPTYDFYDPPIPIQIQGSLFFDMHHAAGPHPGPPSLEPSMPTIWEVHPITQIVFEP